MVLKNCNIWSLVDFGNGPVEIRCTEVGDHEEHRCEIFIEVNAVETTDGIPGYELNRRNIFDDRRVG